MASKKENGLVYIFSYLLTWLSGLIVFITVGQHDKRAKFHALQAIFLGVVMFILGWVAGFVFAFGASILVFLLWIYGLYVGYLAYNGKDTDMPIIGDFARKYSK